MTVAELYHSVAQLGFEDSLESDDGFFYAVNRALLQVAMLRPATRVYEIHHRPMENRLKVASFEPVDKTGELCFEATDVRSYYFEADGNGMCYIEHYGSGAWQRIGMIELTAARCFVSYRGFIKKDGAFVTGRVRLRFVGEYLYCVRRVAMYSQLYSADKADIPAFEPHTRYDVGALVSDFMGLASPPVLGGDSYTRINQGYDVENGRVILLPYDKRGLYKIVYHHRPAVAVNTGEAENDETVLDLDEDLCAGLPMLVAAYVWADDEPEKAEYYLSLWREWASSIASLARNASPVAIENSSGW